MPNRVLVLNHFAVPAGQAGGTRHAELFSRVQGWNHLIVAARRNALTGQRQTDSPGFTFVEVGSHESNGIRRILGWIEFGVRAVVVGVLGRRPTVVYASSPHLLAGLAGLIVARIRRCPMVLEVRDVWPQVLLDMGRLKKGSFLCATLESIERLLYRNAESIVVLAEGSREHVTERAQPGKTVAFIPNGADPSVWTPTESRKMLRTKYGFERFTAVYVGAHGPANGLDFVLDAAERLNEQDIDLVLVGGGVAKMDLEHRATRLGLANVRFLDPVPKTEVRDVLAAADVGMHILADVPLFATAISPNKVFDYMAASLPIVTNCPGVSAELVQEAECGWAMGPADLAAGLLAAYRMSISDRQMMGRRGTHWLSHNRSHAELASRIKHLLDEASGAQ